MQLETKIIDARLHDYLPKYATPEAAAIDLRACSRDGAQKAKRAAALREELARLEGS